MLKRIKYIFGLEWKYARLAFLWNIVEEAANLAIAVVIPYIMKILIDAVLTHDTANFSKIIICALTILAINVFQSVVYMTTVYYRQDYILVRDMKFRSDLYSKVLKIQPDCFESPETYDMYSRVAEYSLEEIHGAFCAILSSIFHVATIVSVAAIMIDYSPVISIVYVVAYIPLFWLKMKLQKKLDQFNVDNTTENRKKNAIFDFIHDKKAVAELKIFGAFPFIISRRNEITKRLKNKYIALRAGNETKQALVEIIPEIVYYVSYIVYAVAVTAGSITFGDLTFLVTAMKSYSTSLTNISIWLTHQQESIYMIDKLIDFYELPEERSGMAEHGEAFESLSLEDVSFTYPGSDNPVLKHINLKINRGEKVAVVGYNGSGKTTTVKLMLGLLNSYTGKYMIDKTDAAAMNHADIYHKFSVGMQDYQKYPFSVRENIEISDCHKKDKEMFEKAATLSGADEIAKELANGYDTNLNKQYDPDGTDLSEGQWHKLILARAIYQSHDVIVFDEPTSSLDPIAEYEFVHNMKNCLSDKTIIMVTHRLSSVTDFDRIVVFRDGEIVGDGSHESLMKTCGTYREMFETQASRYDVA